MDSILLQIVFFSFRWFNLYANFSYPVARRGKGEHTEAENIFMRAHRSTGKKKQW